MLRLTLAEAADATKTWEATDSRMKKVSPPTTAENVTLHTQEKGNMHHKQHSTSLAPNLMVGKSEQPTDSKHVPVGMVRKTTFLF